MLARGRDSLSPGHGAPVSRGGRCSPGETSPPREKGPTGPMRHGEATGQKCAGGEVGFKKTQLKPREKSSVVKGFTLKVKGF